MEFDLNPKIINIIRFIAQKYDIDKIILFGSRARGDNNPKSDIDLAVLVLPNFVNKGHFLSDLEDLPTLLKLDIVFINEYTDAKLVENIEREGVIVYERL